MELMSQQPFIDDWGDALPTLLDPTSQQLEDAVALRESLDSKETECSTQWLCRVQTRGAGPLAMTFPNRA